MKNNNIQDTFYVQAYQELESDNPHIATWAKALIESNGNKEQARSVYIRLRVEALITEVACASSKPEVSKAVGEEPASAPITQNPLNPTGQKRFTRWFLLAVGLIALIGIALWAYSIYQNWRKIPDGNQHVAACYEAMVNKFNENTKRIGNSTA